MMEKNLKDEIRILQDERDKRIEETARLAAQNIRANQWRGSS